MERPAFNSKLIDKTQLYIQSIRRPGAGIRADPDESLRVWALLPSLFATQIRPSENMTSPTKPKVHNIGLLHCCRKMTKPRPHLAGTEHFLKFGLFWDMRTHRQTDRHTDALNAIRCTSTGSIKVGPAYTFLYFNNASRTGRSHIRCAARCCAVLRDV